MTSPPTKQHPSFERPQSEEQLHSEMRLERRAKIAAIAYLPLLYYCFLAGQQEAWFTMFGLVLCIGCALVSEYLARWKHKEKAAMYTFIAGFYALELFGAIGDGALSSPCLWLISLGPVLGTVLLGTRAAYVLTFLSLSQVVVIWAIGASFTLPYQFVHTEASLYLFRIVSLIQYSAFAWIWTKQLRGQVEQISNKNEEIEKAKDELEIAYHSQSSFLATMSHEIRTPMNGILGTAQCLAQTKVKAKHRPWVQTILDSGNALMDVLNAILDISKIDANKLEPRCVQLRLDRICTDVMSEIGRSLGAQRLALSFSGGDAPIMIRGDADRVEQVLRNLVLTIIGYAEHSEVRVRLGQSNGAPTIEICLPESTLSLKRLEILREPNSALNSDANEDNRVALRMKLCHCLISLMKGALEVSSCESEGTLVRWTFAEETSERKDLAPEQLQQYQEIPSSQLAILKILVVDDNAVNRRVAKSQIERLGCTVVTANDGLEAIEASAKQDFDILFMDLHMADCGGLEASRCIRERPGLNQNTPIVAFTADAYDVDHEKLHAAGMCDHLPKPFRIEAVRRILGRHVARSPRPGQVA